ncbi:hypothetical protein T492DRAFT_1104116 [Pavlovales sp. CCMP2436]|nr:hypothetical protein T492DRAFT_1104116 [Pavlovales sp. CCMP2436]|mmetsp:Transcript_42987/g.106022  ORF Transcript_42987/g.106022 Transcript_42987/m.106022 type:complete len:173 (-) Transcript_42987:50-568(-)
MSMNDQRAETWEHVPRQGQDAASEADFPPYICVILMRSTAPGEPLQVFVEQRPADSSVAGGKLCCFGGKRERGEQPLHAILRECREELAWTPSDLVRAVDLYVDGKLIAWFYLAAAPPAGTPLKFEEGVQGVWITLSDARLSEWHQAVLQAWARDRTNCRVSTLADGANRAT